MSKNPWLYSFADERWFEAQILHKGALNGEWWMKREDAEKALFLALAKGLYPGAFMIRGRKERHVWVVERLNGQP